MANNKNELAKFKSNLPQQFSEAQIAFLTKKTPQVFIKYRPGRGGKSFAYVEVGYVTEMLNALFGFAGWDWEYELEPQLSYPNTMQIVVKGKLTVRVVSGEAIHAVVKNASGGGDIKFLQNSKTPVDLADDEKSASADALKKAASLLGIAADVYYPSVFAAKQQIGNKDNITATENLPPLAQAEIEEADNKVERVGLQRRIFALARDLNFKGKLNLLGKDDEQKKQLIKNYLQKAEVKIDSFATATIEVLREAVAVMEHDLNPASFLGKE